ncbi:hypothetical protein VNI00_017705 [Paramarasmius palmivorus]|uniref:Uncharacterized protein n=1 Tax=Paramarasmius palmivorus TaxID=297713 RepID=A0AAW0B5V8_9AGAR
MPKLSLTDVAFIDMLKPSVLDGFRKTIFNDSYVEANPEWFAGYDWINIDALKRYLDMPQVPAPQPEKVSAIKTEDTATNLHAVMAASSSLATPQLAIKVEQSEGESEVHFSHGTEVKTVTHIENGREVFEILSEESEGENVVPKQETDLVWVKSDTHWEDEGQHSELCTGRTSFSITTEVRVQRLERLNFLPSLWPIPQT